MSVICSASDFLYIYANCGTVWYHIINQNIMKIGIDLGGTNIGVPSVVDTRHGIVLADVRLVHGACIRILVSQERLQPSAAYIQLRRQSHLCSK